MRVFKSVHHVLMVVILFSGCATTNTGKLVRMPVESAQEGDIGWTIFTAIVVPIMLPFMLIADLFEVTGVTEDDVLTAAAEVSDYSVSVAQQREEQLRAEHEHAEAVAALDMQHRQQQLDNEEAQADAEYQAAKRELDRTLRNANSSVDDSDSDNIRYDKPSVNSSESTSSSNSERSRVIAGNGRSAMDCVQLIVVAKGDSRIGNGGRVLVNYCGAPVEITWCYPDEPRGCEIHGNTWTLDIGGSWPVSYEKDIRWAACHGANTASFEKGSQGLSYICDAPLRP